MVITGNEGNILQPVHQLVSAHSDIVESGKAGKQILVLAELHHHVHVQDRHAGLIVEIPDHGADGHVGRTMEGKVNLALEAKAQQAAGNGAQVIDALADRYLHRATTGCGSTGVEIRQAGQNQAVTSFCHLQGVSLGDHGFGIQRETAVHLGSAHGHDDDVVSLQIFLNFGVQQLAKNASAHKICSFRLQIAAYHAVSFPFRRGR